MNNELRFFYLLILAIIAIEIVDLLFGTNIFSMIYDFLLGIIINLSRTINYIIDRVIP